MRVPHFHTAMVGHNHVNGLNGFIHFCALGQHYCWSHSRKRHAKGMVFCIQKLHSEKTQFQAQHKQNL